MTEPSKRPRKSIRVARSFPEAVTVDGFTAGDFAFLDDGYVIHRTFAVHADLIKTNARAIHATVEVEVDGKRTRTSGVHVTTDRPGGVSASMLREVPIREIVAKGCEAVLYRMSADADGKPTLTLAWIDSMSADAEAIEKLVGYVEVQP